MGMRGRFRALIGATAAAAMLAAALPGVANAATTWTLGTVTPPAGSTTQSFQSVACPTATDCIGVGYATPAATYEQWTGGTTWSAQTLPQPHNNLGATLSGVSCASANACAIVGDYYVSKAFKPLNYWWNGKTWSMKKAPSMAGLTSAVSCFSATDCLATGQDNSAESWNGSTWTSTSPVVPAGDSSVTLSGVSCPTASVCVAVGAGLNSIFQPAAIVIEQWNGTAWTVVYNALPAGQSVASALGVSCTSASACFAVGWEQGTASGAPVVGISMQLSGGNWTAPAVTEPANATNGALSGISCVTSGAADHCTAVGYFSTGGATGHQALAEYYNGSAWAFQATASPIGKKTFNAVSCAGPGVCAAVGWQSAPKARYLAETN
jgi:hypothetical protein